MNKVTLCYLSVKPNPCCPFFKRWGNESVRMTFEGKKKLTKPNWSWFQAQRRAALKPGENSHSEEGAENWVCSVCLCAVCVWALIKDRRFFKHIRAILSNCFTPSSISTHTKDTGWSTKWCSPALLCTIRTSRPSTDTNTPGPDQLCSSAHRRSRKWNQILLHKEWMQNI